jgi:regulator of cell morphogenesis and NO signaling
MTLTQLADHIEATHHSYLRSALPRISQLAAKVAQAHGSRHPEVIEVQAVFDALREELEAHLQKEEAILFPMCRELDTASTLPQFHCGTVRNPVHVMESEHDNAGRALSELRRLTGDYTLPEDGCNTYRALLDALTEMEGDLHQHIHKENNILFPRAVAMEQRLAA